MTILHLLALGWILAVLGISLSTVKQMCCARRDAICQIEDESAK